MSNKKKGLRVLSLCGGIETGLLALEQLNIPILEYHTYEILPEAITVSQKHFPYIVHHGDLIGEDFTKYKGFDLVIGGMCCFGGNELVLTNKGYRKISDIKVGDYVLTHKNRYKKVTNKFNNGVKQTLSLYTMQSSKIECTPNHRFYVRRLEKKWDNIKKYNSRFFLPPQWIEARELDRMCYVGTPVNNIEKIPEYDGVDVKQNAYKIIHKNELAFKFNNSAFWKMIGRFIGDGWVSEYESKRNTGTIRKIKRVTICCSHNEKEELEQIIRNAGFTFSILKHRTTYEMSISNFELANYLLQFGKGAKNKHLTDDVLNLPCGLLKEFLNGYMSADGCYLKNKDIFQFTTVSKQLAYDIASCWNKVYKIQTSITLSKRPAKYIIENRIVNQNDNYIVRCPLQKNKQDKAFYENGYIWSPFRRIENNNKMQKVYDIEVEEDHSYIVNNIVVHNCQSLSRSRIENKEVNNGLLGKSGIVYELRRALDEIQPKWFMAENVVPSDKDDLEKLNEIMGVEGTLINSNRFVAQDRERYYWTNIPIAEIPESNELVLRDIMETNVDEKYFYKKDFEIVDMNKKVCATLKVNTMEMLKRIYNPTFKCATLTCISGGYQEKKVMDNGRPRKLTEIEYERLQGLPDNYTNEIINGRKISYTKRCSLCGNAWTLPVIKHIFSGLTVD